MIEDSNKFDIIYCVYNRFDNPIAEFKTLEEAENYVLGDEEEGYMMDIVKEKLWRGQILKS